jgi:hypothetical protein
MPRAAPLLVLTAALALSGCGASHPVCTDEPTTRAHTDAFMADLIAAATSKALPTEKMRAVEAELSSAFAATPVADYAGRCRELDRIRAAHAIPAPEPGAEPAAEPAPTGENGG